MEHPNRMSAEELRELVSAMGWAALDLAQHLSWLNEVMHQNPEPGYVEAQRMAYAIVNQPYRDPEPPVTGIDVAVHGPDGLRKVAVTIDDLKAAASNEDEF